MRIAEVVVGIGIDIEIMFMLPVTLSLHFFEIRTDPEGKRDASLHDWQKLNAGDAYG